MAHKFRVAFSNTGFAFRPAFQYFRVISVNRPPQMMWDTVAGFS